MELEELLTAMDRAAANLTKLEAIWERASGFIPTSPAAGSPPEYDDLCRAWVDLLPGLPQVDRWTVTEPLPDIDELGRAFIDYGDIGEHPFALHEAGQKPGRDLAEYRYRLNRARRRAARARLEELIILIDTALPRLLEGVPRDSPERIANETTERITSAISEIERLVGDTAARRGRWGDLYRHFHFALGLDWHDIHELDWPSVRSDVEAAAFSDTEPLPVPDLDLGVAASGDLSGVATTGLRWSRLTDEGFERLLFDLLRSIAEHENVEWLMNTRAPDRGRDLSLERVLRDGTGGVRRERVIVQAKHWLSRSVAMPDVAATTASTKLWEPPVVRGLIVATSGRFTADAVAWTETHNNSGTLPFIDLWPDSRLETLLAQRPGIAAGHGLR